MTAGHGVLLPGHVPTGDHRRLCPAGDRRAALHHLFGRSRCEGGVLRHPPSHRRRRLRAVLGLVGSHQAVDPIGDGASTRRIQVDEVVVDAVDLAQAVGAVAPGDSEASGELGLQDPVVERPGARLGSQKRTAVERPPLAVVGCLGAVEHETARVQLRVAVAGAPFVHPGDDQSRGVEDANAVTAGPDVSGVLLEVAEAGVHGGQVGLPHLRLDIGRSERPQQRDGLDRREGAVPRGHRRPGCPGASPVAGVPPVVRVVDPVGGGQRLGADFGGALLGPEPVAQPRPVGADSLGVERLELGSRHLAVQVERGRAAAPPCRSGRHRSRAVAVLVAVFRRVLGEVVAGDPPAGLGQVVVDGATPGVDLGDAQHGRCLPAGCADAWVCPDRELSAGRPDCDHGVESGRRVHCGHNLEAPSATPYANRHGSAPMKNTTLPPTISVEQAGELLGVSRRSA
jgi:hypothetical protein